MNRPKRTPEHRLAPAIRRVSLIAPAYFLSAQLGRLFVAEPEGLATVWPPSGLALAVPLLSDRRDWPVSLLGIFGAGVLAQLSFGNSIPVSLELALPHSAEPFVAAWLLVRFLGTPITFARLREVIGLVVLAALSSNALTAVLGAAIVSLDFGADLWETWRVWWITHGTAMLVVTPFVVTWLTGVREIKGLTRQQTAGAVVLMAGLVATAQWVFGAKAVVGDFQLPYVTFPFLLWAALRFGPRGSATAMVILAVVSIWNTAQGLGPIAATRVSAATDLLEVQIFLSVITLSTTALAAVMAQQGRAESSLRQARDQLEVRVKARTAELHGSEARLQAAIENLPLDFWACDAEGRYVLQNARSIQRWGNLIGKHPEEAGLGQEIFTEWLSTRQRALAGEVVRSEQTYTTNGQTRYTLKTIAPIWDGEQIRGALGITLDITDLKQAEAEIRRLNTELEQRVVERTAQLQESEGKFSKVFLASPAGISIARAADGRYLDVNQALAQMTGYSREELIGHTSVELGLVDAVARAKILQSAQAHGSVRDVEIQVYTKSKQIVEVLVSIEQIELSGQACLLTLQYDITERKRAEAEIRRLNQELEHRQSALESSNKELEAFSYSVSHDLRAPLRGIDGFSQILLEVYHNQLDAEGQRYLRRVREGSQRMGQLIDDLLKLSQMTRSEMNRTVVDLSALAQMLADELQNTQPKREVEFVIVPGIMVSADANLMRVVLANLLGNAWKYTGRQPRARIEFGVTEQTGQAVYFVRDNGAGFDMAYADKLFGAFQRLHRVDEFEGTGIGLATVQRIVHRHGGRIWAQSVLNEGATFFFTLDHSR